MSLIFRGKGWENWNRSLYIYWWRWCFYGNVQHWWGIVILTLSFNYIPNNVFFWRLSSKMSYIFLLSYSPSVLLLTHRWTLLMRKSGHFILAQRIPFLRNTMAGMQQLVFVVLSYRPFAHGWGDSFVSQIWCWLHFCFPIKIQRHLPRSLWSQLEVKVWGCWNLVSCLFVFFFHFWNIMVLYVTFYW